MATSGSTCRTINKQSIVIPFYVCNVHQPILSVTRLAEQGFELQFNDTPSITHRKGFSAILTQRDNLYYLQATVVPLPEHLQLNVTQATDGTVSAMIAPNHHSRSKGPKWFSEATQTIRHTLSQGFLVRIHKRQRKAIFQPEKHAQFQWNISKTTGEQWLADKMATTRTSWRSTLT